MISRRTLLRTTIAAAAVGAGLPVRSARSGRWERLRARLDGDLVLPGDATYPVARQLDNGFFDTIAPAAIAYCTTVGDVRKVLSFAQDADVPMAVRSGGHSSAGYSTTTGLVLDVSRLNAISTGADRVTLGPGTQGVDLLAALAPSGRATVTGSCPTVCAGGYLQGGGIGPLARRFGVASDSLTAAEVVLADGRVERASAECNPDLFWALRGGGGGNFGVVTRFEVATAQAPRMVSYGLVFPWSAAPEVIAAFQQWTTNAPDELSANANVFLQDAGSGAAPGISVAGGWLGPPETLAPLLDALIAAVGTAPQRRQVDDLTYQQAMMQGFLCGDKTVDQCHRQGASPAGLLTRHSYAVNRGRLLDAPLPAAAVLEVLAGFERLPAAGQSRRLSWSVLGGRINQVDRTATAYVHRGARFYVGVAAGLPTFSPTAEQQAAAQTWADGAFEVIARHGSEDQVNFIDPRLPDWRSAYYGVNYARLDQVKHRYDPNRFFRFPQAVGS